MSKACECEHICHTADDAYRSPNGNPGHGYAMAFSEASMVNVKTPYGTLCVCKTCADDCLAQYRKEEPQ
jgi:hypothetical protein